MRLPVTEIAAKWTAETGQAIDLQFGGSNTLLGSITASKQGDLYLPADNSYVRIAQQRGLAKESLPVSFLTGGLAVPSGNPRKILSLTALLERDDLRIGLGNPETAAIGKLAKECLEQAGLWSALQPRITVFKPTVNDLANDIKLGLIDVAILWDAVAAQYPDLEFVHVPELEARRTAISLSILSSSSQPTEALRFARYLTSADQGLPCFQRHNYDIIEGDLWSPTPHLSVYSAAILRPAIAERLQRFAKHEGIEVDTVYDDCAALVSRIKAGECPDAYFASDEGSMSEVSDRFGQASLVSSRAQAKQFVAIGADSTKHQLVTRLLQALTGTEEQAHFESLGFTWERLPK